MKSKNLCYDISNFDEIEIQDAINTLRKNGINMLKCVDIFSKDYYYKYIFIDNTKKVFGVYNFNSLGRMVNQSLNHYYIGYSMFNRLYKVPKYNKKEICVI